MPLKLTLTVGMSSVKQASRIIRVSVDGRFCSKTSSGFIRQSQFVIANKRVQ